MSSTHNCHVLKPLLCPLSLPQLAKHAEVGRLGSEAADGQRGVGIARHRSVWERVREAWGVMGVWLRSLCVARSALSESINH